MSLVTSISLIGTPAGTNTDLPASEFPSLDRVSTSDLVGPTATNRQPASLEKRTLSLRDKVNLLITNNNIIDEVYLRRDGGSQTGGGSGILGDVAANGFTFTGLRAASAAAEPIRKQEYDTGIAAVTAALNLRDGLSAPDASKVPVSVDLTSGGYVATSTAFGKWHNLIGTSDNTFVLPDATQLANGYVAVRVPSSVSVARQFTISGTGGQTLGGRTSLIVIRTNVVVLMSNGTNWDIVSSNLDTDWVDGGAVSISSTGSAPTKGSSVIRDKAFWRRVGDSIQIRLEYGQSTAGGNGTGDYTYGIPNGFTADSSKVYVGSGYTNAGLSTVGTFYSHSDTTTPVTGNAFLVSSTRLGAWVTNAGSDGVVGQASGFARMDTATRRFSIFATIPIVGW